MSTELDKIPSENELCHLDPIFSEDPAKVLKPVRDQCPVLPSRMFNTEYLLTRYADIRSILVDPTMSAHAGKANPGTSRHQSHKGELRGDTPPIWGMDDPEHRRLKMIVAKAFFPDAVEAQRTDIELVVDQALDKCASMGQFDVVEDFAIAVPIKVISRFLGVSQYDPTRLRQYTTDWVLAYDPFKSDAELKVIWARLEEVEAFFTEQIELRRRSPTKDLISAMVNAEADGERMTTEQVRVMCSALLTAGNATTSDLISNGILRFLQTPDQLAKLRENWDLGANAIEELLRLESPVSIVGRAATKSGNLHGCPYEPGHAFTLSLTAANLDPQANKDPEKFDITRKRIDHIGLGAGIHLCLGAPLARLEGRIALVKFFQRFKNVRLAPGGYRRKAAAHFRGLDELRVVT